MAENVDPDSVDFSAPPQKLLKTSSGRRFSPPATSVDIAILSKGCVRKNIEKQRRGLVSVLLLDC